MADGAQFWSAARYTCYLQAECLCGCQDAAEVGNGDEEVISTAEVTSVECLASWKSVVVVSTTTMSNAWTRCDDVLLQNALFTGIYGVKQIT